MKYCENTASENLNLLKCLSRARFQDGQKGVEENFRLGRPSMDNNIEKIEYLCDCLTSGKNSKEKI